MNKELVPFCEQNPLENLVSVIYLIAPNVQCKAVGNVYIELRPAQTPPHACLFPTAHQIDCYDDSFVSIAEEIAAHLSTPNAKYRVSRRFPTPACPSTPN